MNIDGSGVCLLLGIPRWELADHKFLKAWLDCEIDETTRVLSFPRGLDLDAANETVPFYFRANLCHCYGKIIKECKKDGLEVSHGNIERELRIPKRVRDKMVSDVRFADSMIILLNEAQKPFLMEWLSSTGYENCLACNTNKATGFVNQMTWGTNYNDGSLLLFVPIAYPVCQNLPCNVTLRKERASNEYAKQIMGGREGRECCFVCKKFEVYDHDGKLVVSKCCSKCKKVFYCSKECQVMDWPRHKKECKLYRKMKGKR